MSLIELFDIEEYLLSRNISYEYDAKNISRASIGLNCPFCDDPSNHFGIRLEDKACNCWRCGPKRIIEFIRVIENCSYAKAEKIIEQFMNPLLAISSPEEPQRASHIQIPPHFEAVRGPERPQIARFLQSRGFPGGWIKRRIYDSPLPFYWGGPYGDFAHRLIIPIVMGGQMISWIGRDITGKADIPYLPLDKEKSLASIKESLYDIDAIPRSTPVVIVEGIIDQWKLGTGAIATFGIHCTSEQILLLRKKRPSRIYILFDSEPEAQTAADRLARDIWFCPVEILELEHHKDPGDLSLADGKELMRQLLNP